MKDIDFDELDRAVNSLMSPADTTSATRVAEPATPASPQPGPVSETTPETTAPVAAQARPATATPAARRGGRFMDMVHSSSDMKPRPTTTAPSREGVAITPSRPIVAPAPIEQPAIDQTDQVAAIESERTGITPASPVSSEEIPQNNDTAATEPSADDIVMPDPLDVGALEQPADDETASENENLLGDDQADTVPTNDSPFLSDAKVEKRPLNSEPLAAPAPLVDLSAALNDEPSADNDETKSQDLTDESGADEPSATPVAPELNSELVAIESGERSGVQSDDDETNKPLGDEDSSKKESDKPVGPASIAQQYKTVESTGDKSHAAIYDATQYPEPLAHPAKKKSGWLWVIWVIVLLALGAGGAIGLYAAGIIP